MTMTTSMQGTALQAVESDSLIESSYRRLLAALGSEKEQIRSTWAVIEQERDVTVSELERLRGDTEEWCTSEKAKIDAEWNRLDKLTKRIGSLWPDPGGILEINCSGQAFTLPRSTLCAVEGSNLSQMFSDAFIHNIPRDPQGRLFIDFNPDCFRLIVEYLQNRRLRPDAPVPVIPAKDQQSMDLLAEALKLKPFLNENCVSPLHGTSLLVQGNVVQAMHPGWQVISGTKPLPLSGTSCFEVKILANPNASGGLAIGVCGHIPAGDEVHSIRLTDSVLYNSHNGLMGDCFDAEDVVKSLQFRAGDTVSIQNEVSKNCLVWYYNYEVIGRSVIKQESIDKMQSMYPVFALYAPDTRIQVDFNPPDPSKRAAQ